MSQPDTPPVALPQPPMADPTALGLIGLAVGCAALTPVALGLSLTPAALSTAAAFCLFFGAGAQAIAGLINFVNKNLYGATLFTAFAFNWAMNWWMLSGLAEGKLPDHAVLLTVDLCFLLIFLVMTVGFGYFSKLLFVFLMDIDLLFVCKIINGITHSQALALPVAVFTIVLGLLALWIAFALLLNPVAGRQVFALGGPLFTAKKS